MKITHLIESTATGTLAMVCLAANHFAGRGHKVTVVYSRRPETPSNLAELFHRDVALHVLPMGPKDLPLGLIEVRRKLRDLDPDVLHMHSSFAGFVGRMATIGWRSDLRALYSPHCISFMRTDISHTKRRIFTLLEAAAARSRASYVACSRSEAQAIHRSLGRSAILLENAVDVDFFARSQWKATVGAQGPRARFAVVTAGGIRRQKGFELFAEIARRLSGQGFEFLWIGDGDTTSKAVLTAAGVRVSGWRSREEVRNILHDADTYLSTAAWEGMPISVIEAMAASLPVLASRCAGNIDVIDDGINGLLFSAADEAVNCLERLRGDPSLHARLATDGHHAARRRFAQGRFLHELEQIYIRSDRYD
ncbi:glycosyltransferase [Cupriavidus oxalaticus]|uniref:Glycosyltransferase n=1 Tax=Cupriavidus oxalaticus TaxID=96344 RepID=A0A4P7LI91_9BURK|nr:glycosyltransferase [Cupriavidus oxalaticus]QBY55515.1 glycosyltransferase [Cupriavidus oxalaticus]